MPDLTKIAFLDFEASSLGKQGYPIEVAWVLSNGEEESHLIRPDPTWTDWDLKAEAIHGIARDRRLFLPTNSEIEASNRNAPGVAQ